MKTDRIYESDMTRKEKFLWEVEKLRMLKGRARVEYLWAYYRFVFVIIAVVLLLATAVITMAGNAAKEPVLSIVIVDADRSAADAEEKLQELLEKELGVKEEKKNVVINTSVSDSAESAENIKTIISLSPIEENDVVICGSETYKKFEEMGVFEGEPTELSDNVLWEELGLTRYPEVYACVLKSSENKENAVKALQFLEGKS